MESDAVFSCSGAHESVLLHVFLMASGIVFLHSMTSGFFVWRNKAFIEAYKKNGYANFCGKFASIGLSFMETIDIDEEEDFQFAQQYLSVMNKRNEEKIYHPKVAEILAKGDSFQN